MRSTQPRKPKELGQLDHILTYDLDNHSTRRKTTQKNLNALHQTLSPQPRKSQITIDAPLKTPKRLSNFSIYEDTFRYSLYHLKSLSDLNPPNPTPNPTPRPQNPHNPTPSTSQPNPHNSTHRSQSTFNLQTQTLTLSKAKSFYSTPKKPMSYLQEFPGLNPPKGLNYSINFEGSRGTLGKGRQSLVNSKDCMEKSYGAGLRKACGVTVGEMGLKGHKPQNLYASS
jgi:hypothetical protein